MSAFECPREQDVVVEVLSRRLDPGLVHRSLGDGGCLGDGGSHRDWDEDLAAHVVACDVCHEAATVARLLREEALASRSNVRVPSAGQVWWRAAIRGRMEAVHAAERPMTWVHGLAGACAAGLVVALLGLVWPSIEGAVGWIAARSWSVPAPAAETARLTMDILQRGLPLALVAAAFVILAPLAIYLATFDD
jgi:hypothetical protein